LISGAGAALVEPGAGVVDPLGPLEPNGAVTVTGGAPLAAGEPSSVIETIGDETGGNWSWSSGVPGGTFSVTTTCWPLSSVKVSLRS
jgi:hypothetical protein